MTPKRQQTLGLVVAIALALALLAGPRHCDYGYAGAAPIAAVVAFAFGNRANADGGIVPGPVNRELAAVAVQLQRQTGSPVYAQWEIAEAAAAAVAAGELHAIYPRRGDDGAEIYLSTAGIIAQLGALSGGPAALGPVYVVAHRDHLCRCVEYLRGRGYDAYAPPLPLPAIYDSESTQPWTRSARVYRLVDRLASLF